MAYPSGVISLFAQLRAEGFFEDVKSVLEFGAQEMHCLYHAPAMKACLEKFGCLEGLSEKELSKVCNGPSRHFFEAVGMKYSCIDTSGEDGTLFFDLNFDSVEPPHAGAYDLLTNIGTAEHVFNQYNACKAAHDFVREGGYFLHFMPFLGYVDHGYFSFQPCFYKEMAAANDYEILGMWLNPDMRHDSCLIPWHDNIFDYIDLKASSFSTLCVLMRKKGSGEFKVPYQGRYEKSYAGDFSARYVSVADSGKMGVVSRRALIDGLSGHFLQKELLKRYSSKVKKLLFGWMR